MSTTKTSHTNRKCILCGAPIPAARLEALPGVTTSRENSFVANSQQIVVEVPGVDPEGRIVVLSHPEAAYALSAVVGDGANNHQAWFNLSDLMALAADTCGFNPWRAAASGKPGTLFSKIQR